MPNVLLYTPPLGKVTFRPDIRTFIFTCKLNSETQKRSRSCFALQSNCSKLKPTFIYLFIYSFRNTDLFKNTDIFIYTETTSVLFCSHKHWKNFCVVSLLSTPKDVFTRTWVTLCLQGWITANRHPPTYYVKMCWASLMETWPVYALPITFCTFLFICYTARMSKSFKVYFCCSYWIGD